MLLNTDQINLFKELMGSYPTGVTVVTTMDKHNQPVGLTVNSFASVSIEPLMVLWCIDKNSNSLSAFKSSKRYAINILAGNQEEICWLFASSKEQSRFSKTEWNKSDNNLPIIKGVFGVLECEKVQEIDAGDHMIMIGTVIDLKKNEAEPMLYFRRNVGSLPKDWTN